MQTQENSQTYSAKVQFFLKNSDLIIELETQLSKSMSETVIKADPYLVLKLLEGGWLPFKEAFNLQKTFKDEKTFF